MNVFKNKKPSLRGCQRWVHIHQRVLGLDNWTILVVLEDVWPEEIVAHDTVNTPACVDIDRAHLDATIYVKPSMYDTEAELKSSLLHELMHLRLCTIPCEETPHTAMLIEHAVMGITNFFEALIAKK